MISSLLYNLSIRLYLISIYLASPFNRKAMAWVKGRRGLFRRLNEQLEGEDHIIWFHAASLGEFEQGRPLMEAIRKQNPGYKILLTFFSPSGYEIRKNYEGADYIYYLPADTPANARRFLEIVEPEKVFFIKYEFWFNYIHNIARKEIPLYYVSAIFREKQHFFKSYGIWFRRQLKKVTWFFVQNSGSATLLESIGIRNVSICGDTRFDRVWDVSLTRRDFPEVAEFAEGRRVLLAGSSWPPDEELLISYINSHAGKYKYIIAPHEIHPARIDAFIQRVKVDCLKYSQREGANLGKAEVLFIDNIGILLHLYQYAHIACIGGGFGKNIHNILEAATFGKPVVFGPNHRKFREAADLLALEGAHCVHNYSEFESIVDRLFGDEAYYTQCSEACSNYVMQNKGGTALILKKVFGADKSQK
jgi:3-deoxy-D-manno-octulosonic-acid transferase